MNPNDLLARAQRAEAERDALAERLEKLLIICEMERAIGRALERVEFTTVTGHHE
mgnify:CR=1 FL=1